MPQNRTLKEIAFELLDKYRTSENCAIGEYSFDLDADYEALNKEIASYMAEIEAASQQPNQ